MTKEDSVSKIKFILKELRMSGAKEALEDSLKQSKVEALSYEEFLLELLEIEVTNRKNNRILKGMKSSKLPLEKNRMSFDYDRLPRGLRQQVESLFSGDFVDFKENILAFGNPGSGKTHLLCALAQHLIEEGRSVIFYNCNLLVQEMLLARRELRLPKLLKRLSRYEVLVLDDIGYVQQGKEETDVLFTLLSERYERGSMLISSNLPFSKWDKIFSDPMTTVAAIDRIVHHSIVLDLNLPSYRSEQAKKNAKTQEIM
jgi:DNA replication protein DnaC